jgi:hypothetical protein
MVMVEGDITVTIQDITATIVVTMVAVTTVVVIVRAS